MAKKVSKHEGVRRALKQFGNDAKPVRIQPWLKEQFGIDMTKDHISKAKSAILAAARKGSPAREVPASPAPQPAKPVPQRAAAKADVAPTTTARKAAAIPLDDILYLKELIRRVEPGAVKTLIDAFAR